MAPASTVLAIAVLLFSTGLVTSQTTPPCSSNECERPESQVGLSLDADKPCYSDGDVVQYNCTGDFFGPPDNYCDSTSGWRYSQPICSDEYTSCGGVASPEDGIIVNMKDTYTLYDTVDIACNSGYVLVGTPRKVCDKDGTFKPASDPICTRSIIGTTAPPVSESVSSEEPLGSTEPPVSEPVSSEEPPKFTETTTEHPASSKDTPSEETDWTGLIIGLSVGVGLAIVVAVVFLACANHYWKNAKGGLTVSPDPDYEMESRDDDGLSIGTLEDDGGVLGDEFPPATNKTFTLD